MIDYTAEDFIKRGKKYEMIFQLGGTESRSRCRRALNKDGRLILSSGDSEGRWFGPLDRVFTAAALSPFVSQTLTSLFVKNRPADLEYLAEPIESDRLRPVMDRAHPLNDVQEAIRYVEEGHSRGKVVITMWARLIRRLRDLAGPPRQAIPRFDLPIRGGYAAGLRSTTA